MSANKGFRRSEQTLTDIEVLDLSDENYGKDLHRVRREEYEKRYSTPISSTNVSIGIGKSDQSKFSGSGSLINKENKKGLFIENPVSSEALLSDIFEVHGRSYDVSLYRSHIQLNIIGGNRTNSSKRKSVKKLGHGESIQVSINHLFAASIKRLKSTNSSKQGPTQGLELHTYSVKKANRQKHKIIYLAHPSETICSNWFSEIKKLMSSFSKRPKTCKLILNSYSGNKSLRTELLEKILPLFTLADISITTIEESNYLKIQDCIMKTELSSDDCVLVAGGDGTVHTVVNALVKKVQFNEGVRLGSKAHLVPCNVPVGVIPCGFSNTIAHTVHGTDDMVTAALHIIYGRIISSDVISIFNKELDSFTFGFSAHYGFGGNMLNLLEQFKIVGQTFHQAAIAKSLTKDNLRAYECEIKCHLASQRCGDPKSENPCRSGCTICNIDPSTPKVDETISFGAVQDFDPLDASSSSDQLADLQFKQDKTVRGGFLSVSVFATPCMDVMAPLGFSKFTHIGDGCMDLVLVKDVKRKEFMKFLQRHGNTKNQLDLPFVQSYRLKEASFHARAPISWNFRDKGYSEIDDQAGSRIRTQSLYKNGQTTITSLDDMDSQPSDEDDEDDDKDDEAAGSSNREKSAGSSNSRSSQEKGNASGDQSQPDGHVHPIFQYTLTDRRRKKLRDKEIEKEMREKYKQEKVLKSMWNIDSVPYPHTDLTFQIHQKLVTFYGQALEPNAEVEDVFCFPAI